MKKLSALFLFSVLLFALSGCENMGLNTEGFDEALTPGVDAETTVRTWKKSSDGTTQPVEREVENPPAFQ